MTDPSPARPETAPVGARDEVPVQADGPAATLASQPAGDVAEARGFRRRVQCTGPRFRGAVLPADRQADPGVRGVRRAASARHRPGPDPGARARRSGPVRAGRRPSTRRGLRSCVPSCSSSGSRCSASATGCRPWCGSSAVAWRGPRPASSAAPRSSLADGGGRLLSGLPHEQQCWMSHRDAVFEPPPGFVALASSPGSPVAALREPGPRPVRDPVPPGGRPHAIWHPDPRPLPPRSRRARAALVAGLGDQRPGRAGTRPGRRRRRDLRPLRGRGLGLRRGARPPGGW